jgi:hypothetical protein
MIMKNDKKKIGFSPTKKIFSAAAMLAVSASMLATSTYAWFSMNTQVTATGMNVKAKAEGGIVISNESKADWNASSTASHNTSVELIPTSSYNMTTWYHASSDDAKDAKAGQSADKYTAISTSAGNLSVNEGVGIWTRGSDDTSNIYLLNSFFIKSSSEQMTGETLYVNDISVTGDSTSGNLDKALRLAVVYDTTTLIYAPLESTTSQYTVGAQSGGNVTPLASSAVNQTLKSNVNIPAYSSTTPLEVKVYLFFEGEDANCKSENITATLDGLTATVRFGTTTIT